MRLSGTHSAFTASIVSFVAPASAALNPSSVGSLELDSSPPKPPSSSAASADDDAGELGDGCASVEVAEAAGSVELDDSVDCGVELVVAATVGRSSFAGVPLEAEEPVALVEAFDGEADAFDDEVDA